MTRLFAERVVKAREPVECPRCGRYISVGQQIALCGGLWFCLRCILAHHDDAHQDDQ